MENNQKHISTEDARKVSLGRHKAQCSICKHPDCSEIEEYWVDWGHPAHIENVYHVSRDAIYRHMHALDLFGKRSQNSIRVLEHLMEKVVAVSPSGSAVVSAWQAHRKLLSAAQAAEQAQAPDPKKLFERMSQLERESFARDGTLPEWFSGEIGATPSDSQESEKEGEATETKRLQ